MAVPFFAQVVRYFDAAARYTEGGFRFANEASENEVTALAALMTLTSEFWQCRVRERCRGMGRYDKAMSKGMPRAP